jgi:two-component system, chemotaxis family, chemotaxis protein CheY
MSTVSRLGKAILLVEDDPDIRDTIADVLEEEGYVVLSAKHGAEGLTALREAKQLPAIIILDLMMPVMDGIAFREEQRKNPEWTNIPVIVVSADRTSRDKAEAMGARAYLQKPFNIHHLLDLVREIEQTTDSGDL